MYVYLKFYLFLTFFSGNMKRCIQIFSRSIYIGTMLKQ